MKSLKLTLHNDKIIVLNMEKFLHAMTTRDEESSSEYTRILLEGDMEIDVKEPLDEISSKVWEL
tara:strand:+ start:310 stop:501 length:192 start_codon:yes stop_codon:yes gene_type:complete